ncbi:MAG TPA: hypothetical protein VJP02_05580 [Candidatus Sulfotelmatobacter sp.]|nr:hypothetical protein [Candidatus Sulfotelmatobacter sp.]
MPERKNGTELAAVEPLIVCPNCKKEIRLTESLAAPLVEATRRQYEQKLADKDSDVAKREAEVRKQEKSLDDARRTVDDRIAEGIRKQREKIANEEASKARLLVSDELQGKSKELADLKEILKTKDDKLAEAQTAQAALVRKQRELDDAKRELDLIVETRVSALSGFDCGGPVRFLYWPVYSSIQTVEQVQLVRRAAVDSAMPAH